MNNIDNPNSTLLQIYRYVYRKNQEIIAYNKPNSPQRRMIMKEKYERVEIEFISNESGDVITASEGMTDGVIGGNGYNPGGWT